ncbi:MAG: hypothetical protein QOF81_3093 [Acidimicrobiaceae bacterium]|nr:hypothetical protein [Acidimicrobiaceae bacterium]
MTSPRSATGYLRPAGGSVGPAPGTGDHVSVTSVDQPAVTAPSGRSAPRFHLSAPWRRAWLTFHILVSVAWVGVEACILALGLTGLVNHDPALRRAAYLIVGRIGTFFITPVSLGALVSGLVLGLGTKWGLVRYRWVFLKLAMGVVLTVGSNGAILWRLRSAAAQVGRGVAPDAVDARYLMISAPTVATVLLVTATVLSVYKPWGRTGWGRTRRGWRPVNP